VDALRPLICPVLVGRDDLLALADRRLDEVGIGDGHLLHSRPHGDDREE
jgi:hypothetical protein